MIKKSERGDDDINSNKFKSLEYRCFFKSLSKSEPLDSCNRRQNVRILEGVCSSKARKGTIQRIRTISRAVSIAKTVEPNFRKTEKKTHFDCTSSDGNRPKPVFLRLSGNLFTLSLMKKKKDPVRKRRIKQAEIFDGLA